MFLTCRSVFWMSNKLSVSIFAQYSKAAHAARNTKAGCLISGDWRSHKGQPLGVREVDAHTQVCSQSIPSYCKECYIANSAIRKEREPLRRMIRHIRWFCRKYTVQRGMKSSLKWELKEPLVDWDLMGRRTTAATRCGVADSALHARDGKWENSREKNKEELQ